MTEAAVALRIVVGMVAVALASTGFAGQTPAPSPPATRSKPGARQNAVDLGDVVLARGTHIRGHVRDQAGAPIADAILRGSAGDRAAPIEGRTAADGTFVLAGASAPRYRLSVQAPGFASLDQIVDAPSDGVELVLRAACGITGLVVDDGDRPVELFTVTAVSGGRGTCVWSRARTGASPRQLAAGTYTVDVTTRDLGRQLVSRSRSKRPRSPILDASVWRPAAPSMGP